MQRTGSLLILASAVAFGSMAIFGKLAYDAGVGVLTLLFVRFAIAAPVLWAMALRRGARRLADRRTLLAALAMGGVGYALQAGLFFTALERMDASLLSLILYTFPAFVTVAAVALGRETRAGGASARCSCPRAGSRWCCWARAPARSTGSAPPWRSAPRSPTPRTSSCPTP